MLIDCPKCGFNQPQDRYCANCGVDMEHYKPAPAPLWSRLSDRPLFHVSIAAILAVVLLTWIYQTQKKDIQESLKNAFAEKTAPASEESLAPTEAPEPVAMAMAAPTNAPAAAQALTRRAVAPKKEAAARAPSNVKVSYAEVPRPLVDMWISEGQLINDSGNSRSILLPGSPSITEFAREEWNLYELPGSSTIKLSNEPSREDFLQAVPGSETEIGFVLEITSPQFTASEVEIDIQLLITLPSGLNDDVSSSTVTGRFNMPTNSTLVILGGLPQTRIRGEAAKNFMNTPLQILQSPDYLASGTEFAIFIQPK